MYGVSAGVSVNYDDKLSGVLWGGYDFNRVQMRIGCTLDSENKQVIPSVKMVPVESHAVNLSDQALNQGLADGLNISFELLKLFCDKEAAQHIRNPELEKHYCEQIDEQFQKSEALLQKAKEKIKGLG